MNSPNGRPIHSDYGSNLNFAANNQIVFLKKKEADLAL